MSDVFRPESKTGRGGPSPPAGRLYPVTALCHVTAPSEIHVTALSGYGPLHVTALHVTAPFTLRPFMLRPLEVTALPKGVVPVQSAI